PMQEEEVLGKAYDSRLMRRLVAYLRPYKSYVALALALILLESSLEVAFPWLTKIAIDRYIAAANIAGLTTIAVIYFLLLLIRHDGTDPRPQLGIGIGDVIRCSVDFPDNRHLPPQGARFLPASAHCDRQDQCISSGAHHGDVCCAALQPGAKKREEVRRDQQRTSSCKPGRNFGLFLVLSGDRTAQFGRNRVDHLVWRRKSYPGRSHARCTCGFYSI